MKREDNASSDIIIIRHQDLHLKKFSSSASLLKMAAVVD